MVVFPRKNISAVQHSSQIKRVQQGGTTSRPSEAPSSQARRCCLPETHCLGALGATGEDFGNVEATTEYFRLHKVHISEAREEMKRLNTGIATMLRNGRVSG